MTVLQFPNLSAINALPKGLLYPHQSDGVSFLISKGRAILGDDMGLGKTRQAIIGMQIAAPTGMILVVCPASLKLNWRREIKMVVRPVVCCIGRFAAQELPCSTHQGPGGTPQGQAQGRGR